MKKDGTERSYKIFGRVIKLHTIHRDEGMILHKELELYPIVETSKFDVAINYVDKVEADELISNNPGIHKLSLDSMTCQTGAATIKFYFEDQKLRQIDFSIDQKSGFKRATQKWKSMQFTTNYEAIGQIFHELILVPMAFLFEDCSIVHSSGIVNSQSEVVLFGGTGGVGKTSLEMTLCLDHGYKFFNDDIAVMDTKGFCHPNFSYPKIYGYNLLGAPDLKKEIFDELSQLNKFHYGYRALKGASKVRRRVEPVTFYGQIHEQEARVSSLVILIRSNVEQITLEAISNEKAAEFNSLIMATEYNVFFDHIRWHQFNAGSLRKTPFASYESIIKKNTRNLEKGLQGLEKVYLAHIPMNISNSDFKAEMVNKLKEVSII